MVWTVSRTPGKVCATEVYNSSTTSRLSAINTTQPQMILFDKWDKERKANGTVQSINGPYRRTEDANSELTKETGGQPREPDYRKIKIYQKLRWKAFPVVRLLASCLKQRSNWGSRILWFTKKTMIIFSLVTPCSGNGQWLWWETRIFFFFFSFLFGREGSRLSGQWLPISTGYTVNSRYKAVRKAGLWSPLRL